MGPEEGGRPPTGNVTAAASPAALWAQGWLGIYTPAGGRGRGHSILPVYPKAPGAMIRKAHLEERNVHQWLKGL